MLVNANHASSNWALVSGFPELAKTKYIHRYNKATAHMHWKICKEFGIEVKERWYEHEPKTVTENDGVTILWDMPIHTDMNIAANRPDIELKKRGQSVNTSVSPAKKSPVKTTYNINETPLESCDTEKDLGVWASSNLTSDKQVTEQRAKANKLLGFVRRASRYIQSTQTRRTLYLSIVRCHLGYATQVWSPQSIGLLKRVENVQRRATKLILKLPFRCDVTYKTRLQLTNLLPISYWHEILDTVFFYKAVKNLVITDSEALPETRQSTRSTRSSSSNAISILISLSEVAYTNCKYHLFNNYSNRGA